MTDQPAEVRHRIGRDGSFTLRTVSGNINVRGAETDEAVVIARTSHGSAPRLNVERGSDRLVVELPRINASFFGRGFGAGDADIDFEIELPRQARVSLAAVSAEVVVDDMHGEHSYKTVSGDLTMGAVDGPITVRSVSGDVRLRRGGRVSLEVVTTSGDLEVEAERIEQLNVRSVSGDVDISSDLAAGPRHSVETVSGDLRLQSAGGVTVQPARALDIGRGARRPIVIGDGAAQLSFRSMSGEEHIVGGRPAATGTAPASAAAPATPNKQPAPNASPPDRLDILRALERGEIDVEEAYRQLEEVSTNA